jgi:hypothetical protein
VVVVVVGGCEERGAEVTGNAVVRCGEGEWRGWGWGGGWLAEGW